jgi:hypothetical protein
MKIHRLDVSPGQDQADGLALRAANGAEDVGGCRALVVRRGGSGAALRPASGDLGLLAAPGFVGEPDFYVADIGAALACDRLQRGGEVCLDASTAAAAWA